MLKKLLVLLPALALMLAIVSPVRAAAYEYPAISDPAPEYTVEQLMPEALEYDNYFMFFDVGNYWNNYSIICFNNADAVVETDETGKIYIYSVDSSISFPVYSFRQSGSDAPYSTGTSWKNRYYFIINFNTNNIKSYINYQPNDFSSHFVPSGGNSSSTDFTAFENGISSVINPGLKVDVSFDPDLSGFVDRSVTSGWTKSTVENLHVSISSNKNIQYCWAIVDSGCSVHFNDGNSRFVNYNGRTFVDTNHDLRYVYITSEWNYCAGSTSQIDSAHEARGKIVKVLSACSWHYLSKGQTQELDVSFNQMNLSSSDDYDVVVYALPTDLDIVSCIPYGAGSAMDGYDPSYSVDFSQVVEVYRSGFSLAQSTVFDPDNSSFGVYAYDPQGDNSFSFDKADAFYTDDGEMVIRDTSIKDFVSGHDSSSWSTWHGSSSGGSDVTSSITTVTKSVSSYFGFLNAVFAYLPNVFTSLLGVGFTAFIVLGILRVLLGR